MKIENVETFLVSLPFDSGSTEGWAARGWTTLDYVLLRIDTDAGVSGWGDAFGYGAARATKAALDHMIAPGLIGRDARDIAGIHRALQMEQHLWGRYGVTLFAISGVDIALWDIAGKAAGMPLHRMLGGARRTRIPAYASLFRYENPEVVAERTRAALDEGYRYIKLHEVSEPEVRAARDEMGAGVPMMVDVNCPWTPHQARAMAETLMAYELHWLEEPIFPPEDFRSLAALHRATGVPLAAGENACSAFQFREMIASGGIAYLQPSVTKVGGITEFLKIVALAEAGGATLMPHSPYFGPGLLASLHLLATLPDECLAELFYYKSLPASFYGDATRAVDGHMQVPDAPGLGLDPDPDVIREHRVPT